MYADDFSANFCANIGYFPSVYPFIRLVVCHRIWSTKFATFWFGGPVANSPRWQIEFAFNTFYVSVLLINVQRRDGLCNKLDLLLTF